jgi:hypothetical protein
MIPTVCEISRPDTLVYVVAGDLNLQAKLLILLGSISASKTNPSNLLKLLGFFSILVAGHATTDTDIRFRSRFET